MKHITLSQGKFAIVDDLDFEWLNQWKWTYDSHGYAYRRDYKADKKIYMHREILRPEPGLITDHINRNKLDNRRLNLRAVTKLQNNRNHGLSKRNKSGYTGVIWFKAAKAWRAYYGGKEGRVELGYFNDIADAVKARNEYVTGL